MTEQEMYRLVVNKLDKIDDRVVSLNDKFENKMSQMDEKFDNHISDIKSEISKLTISQSRLDTRCESRKMQSDGMMTKVANLAKGFESMNAKVGNIQNKLDHNEWKIFGKLLLKSAAFVTTIGGAGVLVYKVVIFMSALGSP